MAETVDHWGEVLNRIREGWLEAPSLDGRVRQKAVASLAEVHLPMLVGYAHELRAELAALRQQLDEVRVLLWPDGGARCVPQEHVTQLPEAIEWLLSQRVALTMALDAAEADRDRLLVVCRAAEELVDDWRADRVTHGGALSASAAPAEPAPVVSAPLISAETTASPRPLLKKFEYTIPGLDGTWRLMGLETTNMGADGCVTLHLVRAPAEPAPAGPFDEKMRRFLDAHGAS